MLHRRNHLDQNFMQQPAGKSQTMTLRQLQETMLATGGKIKAQTGDDKGDEFELKYTQLAPGVFLITSTNVTPISLRHRPDPSARYA